MNRDAGDVARAETCDAWRTSSVTSGTRALLAHCSSMQNSRATTSMRATRSRCFATSSRLSLSLDHPDPRSRVMLARAFGYTPPDLPASHWIPPALGTAVLLYGGLTVLARARSVS